MSTGFLFHERCMRHNTGRHAGPFIAELTVDAPRRLCDGRLVAEHEGGYSAELVPFCGLAGIDAMSGITTACTGTIPHAFPAHTGGQDLQPHQAAAIDDVGRFFATVPA